MRGLGFFLAILLGVFITGFLRVEGFGGLLLAAAIPWFFVLNLLPLMIWLERKGSAYIQDRNGPERAYIPGLGIRLAGLVHNVADVLKLFGKEEIVPKHVNRTFYVLAPAMSMTIALVIGAIIPMVHPIEFSDGSVFRIQALDVNVGILWLLAFASLGVYAIVLAGWASNNKYGQLSGLRASASMISYEITMGLAIVTAFLVYGSADLNQMVAAQGAEGPATWLGIIPRWGVFMMPVACVLYIIAAFAETSRAPFDMIEAESELVAGAFTEYGSFKFALFFMAEYCAMVVQAMIIVTLFFGGWQPLPYGLLGHEWLSLPGNLAAVLRVILAALAAGASFAGLRLLRWHKTNRLRWKDARSREGAVLAVLLGFGPAATAAILLLWSFGWTPGHDAAAIGAAAIQFLAFAAKTLFFCWLFVWVRWSVPRFRYDQIMGLGWKVLLPLGVAQLVATAFLVQLGVF